MVDKIGLKECLVFGKKDDRVQELVTAVVVLKPDQEKKVNVLISVI